MQDAIANDTTGRSPSWLPWAITAGLLAVTAGVLHLMGRVWWCQANDEGGEAFLWAGDIWTAHNSQHLVDPYTFSHVLHGVVFAWVFYWIKPLRKQPFAWQLIPATIIEAAWEIFENTPLIINRYREATMALGYSGDSIGNSLGDLGSCLLGFAFAFRVRWYWSVAFFIATEIAMLIMIRDNLTLNVVMLLYPIDAVREWQSMGM
tara:strand:- start:1020 stop:1634 length:615 start_codon:yes stop_codon:yes gene_type:complete